MCLFACLFFILLLSPVRSIPWRRARMQPDVFGREEVGWDLELRADQAGRTEHPSWKGMAVWAEGPTCSRLSRLSKPFQTLAGIT